MNPWWSLYFIATALLGLMGLLALEPAPLFALAVFQFPRLPRLWSHLRLTVSVVLASTLLYWQSSLPGLPAILDKLRALAGFSLNYWMELLARLDAGKWLLGLIVGLAAYLLISKRLRVSVLALLLLGFSALITGSRAGPDDAGLHDIIARDVEDYYQAEAQRQVLFDRNQTDKQDVLIVQVCSMGWADLRRFGLDTHPLWRKLDVLMTRFNSGTSYSNPAALRLLRGACGHSRHADLYTDAAATCYLGEQLKAAGYKTDILMNHTGEYSNFLEEVIRLGRFSQTVAHIPAPVLYRGFSGPAVLDDEAILNKWWRERSASAESRATYYNTISLHDGNHPIDQQHEASSVEDYPLRAKRLLDSLQNLLVRMEASGKKAIVVIVGEHGAALAENAHHLEGLREIPAPDVTLVPAGIKLIGFRKQPQRSIETPTSYPELTSILSQASSGLPITPPREAHPKFMAENLGKQVFGQNGSLYIRDEQKQWVRMADWE